MRRRSVWDVDSTSFDGLFVVDCWVGLLSEHGRVDLLFLVCEKRCLDLVDAGIGTELEVSSGS